MSSIDIEERIDRLEGASVETLLEYLEASKPEKQLSDKAKIALGSFSVVQRRRSAITAGATLTYMMRRFGVYLDDAVSRQRLTEGTRQPMDSGYRTAG